VEAQQVYRVLEVAVAVAAVILVPAAKVAQVSIFSTLSVEVEVLARPLT
jgi:hypothetical protein